MTQSPYFLTGIQIKSTSKENDSVKVHQLISTKRGKYEHGRINMHLQFHFEIQIHESKSPHVLEFFFLDIFVVHQNVLTSMERTKGLKFLDIFVV